MFLFIYHEVFSYFGSISCLAFFGSDAILEVNSLREVVRTVQYPIEDHSMTNYNSVQLPFSGEMHCISMVGWFTHL